MNLSFVGWADETLTRTYQLRFRNWIKNCTQVRCIVFMFDELSKDKRTDKFNVDNSSTLLNRYHEKQWRRNDKRMDLDTDSDVQTMIRHFSMKPIWWSKFQFERALLHAKRSDDEKSVFVQSFFSIFQLPLKTFYDGIHNRLKTEHIARVRSHPRRHAIITDMKSFSFQPSFYGSTQNLSRCLCAP